VQVKKKSQNERSSSDAIQIVPGGFRFHKRKEPGQAIRRKGSLVPTGGARESRRPPLSARYFAITTASLRSQTLPKESDSCKREGNHGVKLFRAGVALRAVRSTPPFGILRSRCSVETPCLGTIPSPTKVGPARRPRGLLGEFSGPTKVGPTCRPSQVEGFDRSKIMILPGRLEPGIQPSSRSRRVKRTLLNDQGAPGWGQPRQARLGGAELLILDPAASKIEPSAAREDAETIKTRREELPGLGGAKSSLNLERRSFSARGPLEATHVGLHARTKRSTMMKLSESDRHRIVPGRIG
jgi:hypothetical protein